MIKIKKATLVFLIILAVVCGAAGLYTLQTTGAAAKFGLGGGHTLNEISEIQASKQNVQQTGRTAG